MVVHVNIIVIVSLSLSLLSLHLVLPLIHQLEQVPILLLSPIHHFPLLTLFHTIFTNIPTLLLRKTYWSSVLSLSNVFLVSEVISNTLINWIPINYLIRLCLWNLSKWWLLFPLDSICWILNICRLKGTATRCVNLHELCTLYRTTWWVYWHHTGFLLPI